MAQDIGTSSQPGVIAQSIARAGGQYDAVPYSSFPFARLQPERFAAVAGLSFVPAVQAHPPVPYPSHRPVYPVYRPQYPVYRPHHVHYRVLYRTCGAEPWRVYGSYYSDGQAHHAERHLRSSGYQAYVNHGY